MLYRSLFIYTNQTGYQQSPSSPSDFCSVLHTSLSSYKEDLTPCIANNMKHNMYTCAQRECVQFNNCFQNPIIGTSTDKID